MFTCSPSRDWFARLVQGRLFACIACGAVVGALAPATFGFSPSADEPTESPSSTESKNDVKKEVDDADDKKPDKTSETESKGKDSPPAPVVTHGTVEIDGRHLAYAATAGKMVQKSDEGDAKAHVFFVSYTKQEGANDEKPDARRPVTFCFNGGPGSSSVWLHLGMLGPQRVKLDSDACRVPPPAELIANPYSLLDVTDLVFIDPVSTGYSRPAKGEAKKQFHGYDEDVRSIAQFIHDYTSKYGRWGSPKFLLGESYGGLRAAGLSGELQDRYHMYLNGLVLVSAVIDFQTLQARGNNDIPYVLFFPSFAATAWYHKKLDPELLAKPVEEVVETARAFAKGPYARALLAGDDLPPKRRQKIVDRMAQLSGLSADYVDRSQLRVSMPRFGKELLRDRRQVVGRFDSRYVGVESDHAGSATEHDPSAAALFGPFASAMNQYLRDALHIEEEQVYEILTDKVQPWDFSEFVNRYVDASDTLRRAMSDNPYLHVYAALGYYDLATPAFAMEYTRDHLQLPQNLRGNFSCGFYEGGHMMYVHGPSLEKLRRDLVEFYANALKK